VVTAFKDEPKIVAWNIGDAVKIDHDAEAFINLNRAIADEIRKHDPNHLISTGMISTRLASITGNLNLQEKLHRSANLDFITMHVYNRGLARELTMPFVIQDAGFTSNHFSIDRSSQVRANIEHWFDRGASGYIEWGFMADIDNGDDDDDWESLFRVYPSYADWLGLGWL